IGNGTEETINNNMIHVTNNIIINWNDENSLQTFIEEIYLLLSVCSLNASYFTNKTILTTKNEYIDDINSKMLNQLPDIPSHELQLKTNTPIICLHNLDPINSLCNGTRLICRTFNYNIIEAEINIGNQQENEYFFLR
ncbi:12145_t:CDS:2, partial [Cetraspora pellucida]